MSRLRWILPITLAVTVLGPVTATSSVAAAPTCLGKPATVVISGSEQQGEITEGDDVIVSSGSEVQILAQGGDDLICVTGKAQFTIGGPSYVEGGDGDDQLRLRTDASFIEVSGVESIDIRLEGKIRLSGAKSGTVVATKAGSVATLYGYSEVKVDLEDHLLRVDGHQLAIRAFDHLWGFAPVVDLTADAGPDSLVGVGCRITLRGGKGDDRLEARSDDRGGTCEARGARLLGLKGDDKLFGSALGDVLLGGPGRDTAQGRGGKDRCDAERTKGCERRVSRPSRALTRDVSGRAAAPGAGPS
jgi:Ca2+-binding RTX toxin-like protein